MSDTDQLTTKETEKLLKRLRRSAPISILVETSVGGELHSGSGYLDGSVTALEVETSVEAEPLHLVFPTYLIAHHLARFFGLGPRPLPAEECVFGIAREHLDNPDGRSDQLTEAPGAVREAIDRDDAVHWSVTLVDAPTNGELFVKLLEVYDAHEGGIWIISPSTDRAAIGAVSLSTASSSMVWAALTDLLPDGDAWDAIIARRGRRLLG